MLKAVIFDMDGVIMDSEPIHFIVDREIFKELKVTISEVEHQSFVGTIDHDLWAYIQERFMLDLTVDELIEKKRKRYLDYLETQANEVPIPGVVALIQDLSAHQIKLAVASSASRKNIELVLKLFKLEQFFQVSVCGDDVTKGKPDPAIFLQAALQLGVNSSECAVIEDARHGVWAAKKAGMKCIGFINPHSGKQELSFADLIISDFVNLNYQILNQL